MKRSLAALAAAAVFAAAPVASAATVTVHVGFGLGTVFNPGTVNINAGDTVTWVWDSGLHSTTAGTCDALVCTPATTGEVWDSGISGTVGNTYSHTFDAAGTFHYFCRVHTTMMQADVVVTTPVELTSFRAE